MTDAAPTLATTHRIVRNVVVALFVVYAVELLAFAILGHTWTDEAWYFNDGVMYSHGYLPYRDFFYHRLPIVFLPYAAWYKLVGVSLLSGRILSVIFALCTLRLVYAIGKQIGSELAAAVAVAIVVFNHLASYYLASVSTYSLGALLVTAASYWYVRKSGTRRWNLALSGFSLALAWGILYPISQATVWAAVFLIFVAFGERDDRRSRFFGIGGLFAGLIPTAAHIMVAPSSAYFSTVTWNFKLSSYLKQFDVVTLNAQTLLRLQAYNQVETIRTFFVVWLFLLPALVIYLYDRRRDGTLFKRAGWIAKREIAFLSAIILINEAFYMVAPQSSVDQRTYVFPIAACLCGILLERVWRSLGTRELRLFSGSTAIVLLFASLFLQERPRLSLRKADSDLAAINRISDRVCALVPGGERILTFVPTLAGQSGRELVKGVAMEYYSIVPTWTAQQIGSRPMTNIDELVSMIRSQTPGAIVLDNSRFFSDEHMGRLMLPYRSRLMDEISKTYVMQEEVKLPASVYAGAVRIYLPLRLAHRRLTSGNVPCYTPGI